MSIEIAAASSERPAAHLSIEPGHFYRQDFARGEDGLTEHFRSAVPGIKAFTEKCALERGIGVGEVVVSTSVLLDDYLNRPDPRYRPAQIIDTLTRAAKNAGIKIDYIAREGAYVDLAKIAMGKIIDEESELPEFKKTIRQHKESGSIWLAGNNPHSLYAAGAMEERPPLLGQKIDSSYTGQGIYMDVELYGKYDSKWYYSCPNLAAQWQVSRTLEYSDRMFAEVYVGVPDADTYEEMPPIMQVNPSAPPFVAESTASILPIRYLPIEHAVMAILNRQHPNRKSFTKYAYW